MSSLILFAKLFIYLKIVSKISKKFYLNKTNIIYIY